MRNRMGCQGLHRRPLAATAPRTAGTIQRTGTVPGQRAPGSAAHLHPGQERQAGLESPLQLPGRRDRQSDRRHGALLQPHSQAAEETGTRPRGAPGAHSRPQRHDQRPSPRCPGSTRDEHEGSGGKAQTSAADARRCAANSRPKPQVAWSANSRHHNGLESGEISPETAGQRLVKRYLRRLDDSCYSHHAGGGRMGEAKPRNHPQIRPE